MDLGAALVLWNADASGDDQHDVDIENGTRLETIPHR